MEQLSISSALGLAVHGCAAGLHHNTVSISFQSPVASPYFHSHLYFFCLQQATHLFHTLFQRCIEILPTPPTPCFLAFSPGDHLGPPSPSSSPYLAVVLSPSTHHSLISISPKVIWVEHISHHPLLPQSLLKPLWRNSYLKIPPVLPFWLDLSLILLIPPLPPSFFHSPLAVLLTFPQSF